ncbi:MAG: sigma-70 family RNA polymerase sigma factor [Myxococcota bacterium]
MNTVPQLRLDPKEEREIARRILSLEDEVRGILAAVPASAEVLDRKNGRVRRTRAAAVDRLEAAVGVAESDPDAPKAPVTAARRKWAEAQQLRWRLALSATRVAYREARRLAGNPTLTERDLVQEGLIGLLGAAKRFEPDRDIRFATYARWWVRAEMTRAIELGRVVRMSAGACEQLRNLRKQIRIHESAGVEWTVSDVAAALGIETERARRLLGVGAAQSLDEPTEDDGQPVGTQLADESVPAPDDACANREEIERLRAALSSSLPDRQRRILIRKYGIGEEPWTLAEIARGMSLSRERIRQLERESLAVLRDACTRVGTAA